MFEHGETFDLNQPLFAGETYGIEQGPQTVTNSGELHRPTGIADYDGYEHVV